jgi:hypothetical protein
VINSKIKNSIYLLLECYYCQKYKRRGQMYDHPRLWTATMNISLLPSVYGLA